jgi:hypothetical protein
MLSCGRSLTERVLVLEGELELHDALVAQLVHDAALVLYIIHDLVAHDDALVDDLDGVVDAGRLVPRQDDRREAAIARPPQDVEI